VAAAAQACVRREEEGVLLEKEIREIEKYGYTNMGKRD
jgi:hypothetical protein